MDILNSLSQLSQLGDMVSSGFGVIQAILGIVQGLVKISGFVLVGMIGVTYAINGFQNMYIGRKAGLDKDWMPFVPFAHTIYRLQMVNEQWWKMFFLELSLFYGTLLYVIILAVSNGKWMKFGIIVFFLYLGFCVAYRIYYRYKFYKAFGIEPVLSLLFISFFLRAERIIDLLIACTNLFEFGGDGINRTVAGTARSVVNVRENPESGNVRAGAAGGFITGLSGMYAGQTLPLAPNDEMMIGRDNALCNLIVDQNADKVSRKHCGIVYDGVRKVYLVTDYSTNGTFIDGGSRLVANIPTTLQSGTILALGSRENRFKLG